MGLLKYKGRLIKYASHVNRVKIGGRWYPYVRIGDQLWLAENLDWKFPYNDGTLPVGVEGVPETPAAWYYDNDGETYGVTGNKYGLLYNWYAAKYLDDNRGTLLPQGWYVPTREDFSTCDDNIPSNPSKNSNARAASWNDGTNLTGLTLLPVGMRYGNGNFDSLGVQKEMWTSEAHPTYSGSAYSNYVYPNNSAFCYIDSFARVGGCSIRLVKNL